jgi:hypothetical protein
VDNLTQEGILAIRSGNLQKARVCLSRAVQSDRQNATAWLALSFAVAQPDQKRHCLEQVLRLEPHNGTAVAQLARLEAEKPEADKVRLLEPSGGPPDEQSPLVSSATALVVPVAGLYSQYAEPTPPPVPPQSVRRHFAASLTSLFSEPYLPGALLILLLIVIISDALLVLIGQPPGYWRDYNRAILSPSWLRELLVLSPWLFAAVSLLYSLLVAALLLFLNRAPALILWLAFAFLHLGSAIGWMSKHLAGALGIGDPFSRGLLHLALSLIGMAIIAVIFSRHYFAAGDNRRASAGGFTRPLAPLLGAAAWFLLLSLALVRATWAAQVGWREVIVEQRPPARINGIIAYDTGRERAVLFSGATTWLGHDGLYVTDTWEWDGDKWLQLSPQQQPPGRAAHAMAYDEERSVVVLFGGRNRDGALGDTWEWGGLEWQLRTTSGPSPRCCHQLWYDTERKRIVLHGGYDLGTHFYDETWEWDGATWTQVIESQRPGPIASGYASAYDLARNQAVVLLAGWPTGTFFRQGVSWRQAQLAVEPPERSSTQMAYDTGRQQIIVFGGLQQHLIFNDTWHFDGQQWHEFDSPSNPSGRWGHTLFYDQRRQRVMLFGGYDGTTYHNDLWEFVPGTN